MIAPIFVFSPVGGQVRPLSQVKIVLPFRGEGGGGIHPVFWYLPQNRPQELWLSTRSRLEKGGLSLTQVL